MEQATMPRLLVRCFGPLRIDRGDERLLPRSRKARAILAFLVMSGSAGASRDRLSGLLWGMRGQEQARASVRQALTEIRAALGEQLILADRLAVRLEADAIETDLGRVVDALRRTDIEGLAEALAALDGDLFADLDGIETEFDHWLLAQRSGVTERIVTDALKLFDGGGVPPAAGQRMATALQRLDSGNEAIARAGLRFDFAAGDAAGARRRFQRLSEQLARDLDAAPSAETAALLERGIVAPAAAPVAAAASGREPTPPVLIVAPFEVLGDDPETALLARICADDVLTVLGRFRDIAVATGEGEDDPAAHRDAVGVYALEGSVRSQAGMLRANLRLRDRRSGRMLWSHQAQLEAGGMAHAIDGIVAQVVGAIAPTIAHDVGQSAAVAGAPDAPLALYLRARAIVASSATYAEARAAADLLERALDQSPRDAQALLLLARIYNTDFLQTIVGHDQAALRERALDLAQRAAALDPLNSRAKIILGWCMLRAHEADAARANFRAALLLNPYNADCVNAAGFGLVHLGDLEEAETLLDRAISLNPVPHGDYFADMATLLMLRGEHRAAARNFAMQADGAFHYLGLRAANLGWLGVDAAPSVAALRTRFARMWTGPRVAEDGDIVTGLESYLPFARAADRARLRDGLRRAGLG